MNRKKEPKMITKTTTEADILKKIDRAKEDLQLAVTKAMGTNNVSGEDLVRAAQQVRNAEALAHQQIRYRRLLDNIDKPELSEVDRLRVQTEFLFKAIANGADDTWSGRMNDSSRAAHDAVLDWARDQMFSIQFDA